MEKIYRIVFDTPIGKLFAEADDMGICGAGFWDERVEEQEKKLVVCQETPLLTKARHQLEEYAAGQRRTFDLPLSLNGTEFQKRVWKALCTIPYGETRTYGQIAAQVGSPKGSRAVGMANHNNPVAIIVPCHRVIGANGKLTGYAGGLDKKEKLLALERQ